MDLTVLTPPSRLPLDVSDVQEFLRLDTQDDLETVNTLIKAATDMAEQYTNRTFITTEYQLFRKCLSDYVELDKGSIQAVSELKVHNDDATSEVLTDFILIDTNMDGKLYPASGTSWTTSGTLRTHNAVEITYTAGYGDNRANMPQGLINALLQIVAFLYENRQGEEVPASLKASLDTFRILVL